MKKKDHIIATCTDYTHDTLGIVHHDGIAVFVKNLIVGEEAEIEIIKVLKNYCVGRIVRLIKTSPEREEPICPVYKQCGGCSLMHMSQEGQQAFKTNRVKETLHKIGHCDAPVNDCLMDLPPYHYRNKVQVPFGMNKGRLVSGFYKARTNEIIDHDFCMIQNEFSNTVTKRVKELFERYSITPYDKEKKQGMIKHVLTRYGTHTDEGMLVFITYTKKIPHLKNIVRILVEEFPQIKTVIQNINTRHDNVILGDQEIILYGDGVIHDTLLGNTYTISLKSFYQINPRQVEVLYAKAIAYAHFQKEDIVIDAYCGIGTIALSLASQVKEVYGVEVVPQAIEDAKKNALANGITNAYFTCDDAGDYMVKCAKEGKHIDVVMVDPPRKGCSELFLSQLVTLSPDRIVYISCNVSTQARDIDILQQHGYQVEEVTPVDMFPQTNHVETVVMLSHKKPDSVINVKVEFGEGEGKVPLDNIAKRAEAYKPKERVTYKMIKEYIEAKYGFKVHTAYIAEVKRDLGLPMYDAPNAVEELKQPRKHPTPEKVEAIKDALKHFEVI